MAHQQTEGRGSRGRQWQSPLGNLYLSVLLRPIEPAGLAGLWSLLAAVVLREALGNPDITLKWPNDLLLNDGKLAGILLDSAGGGDELDWLVIGFGANLAVAPELMGRTSSALGACNTEDLARSVLARIDVWREAGLPAAREAWLAASWRIGTTIKLTRPAIEGKFCGLSGDGALLVQGSGGIISVSSGEVFTTSASVHDTK